MISDILTLRDVAGSLITASATILLFGYITKWRDQKKKGIELLQTLLTDEAMIRSRLVLQEYLVPGVNRRKFKRFHGMDFEQINEILENGTEQEQRDRLCLRAIPSFFWLVNEAMRNGVITKDSGLWSRIYSYYWVFVIEPRRSTSKDIFYEYFAWMTTPQDLENRRKEYAERMEKAMMADSSV